MKVWEGNKVLTVTVQPGDKVQVFQFPEEILNVVGWEVRPLDSPMSAGTLKIMSGEVEGTAHVTENDTVAYYVSANESTVSESGETADILMVHPHSHEPRNGMILEVQYVPMSLLE